MVGNTLKQSIQKDIHSSTYVYFKNVDLFFRDYIYGDPYYVCLDDAIYRYLVGNSLSKDLDSTMLGIIDFVQLVSRLYEVFIRADRFFRSRYSGKDRDRKNYLMVSLRKATGRLLDQQVNTRNFVYQDTEDLGGPGEFRYVSLFCKDGGLIEDISWRLWKTEQADIRETDFQRQHLDACVGVLNDKERAVVDWLIEGRSNPEICSRLHIEPENLRKIVYAATRKLQKRYLESKSFEDDSLN
jgi:DNA-binding CsgD family transcriptional regulator